MDKTRYDDMLEDGYTTKFAKKYISLLEKEMKSKIIETEFGKWANSNGFLAESAYAYGLNPENINQYLSDYDYYRIWPLNDWEKIWVNDKMTLKYVMDTTEFKNLMPEYYYYVSKDRIFALMDEPFHWEKNEESTTKDFIRLLKEKKEFACKPCNGAAGSGFFKVCYDLDGYKVNGRLVKENELEQIVLRSKNYIVTEFLHPCEELATINGQIHTLRLVVINQNGNNPIAIGGYLRFSKGNHEGANYIVCNDEDTYNIFCEVDLQTGQFGNAKKIFLNKIENIEKHPDSKKELGGYIPDFLKLKESVYDVCRKFSTLEYLGFDIGVTCKGPRIMEINTHPGIKYMQIFNPFFLNDGYASNYFRNKIEKIDAMSYENKKKRNIEV